MKTKLLHFTYWLLPSVIYWVDLVIPSVTYSDFEDSISIGVFALLAIPVYIMGGAPPAWAWLAAGLSHVKSQNRLKPGTVFSKGIAVISVLVSITFWILLGVWLVIAFLNGSLYNGRMMVVDSLASWFLVKYLLDKADYSQAKTRTWFKRKPSRNY